MKQKTFFIIFERLLVAKNCLRTETLPLTILAIKKKILCNFAKTLKGLQFMGHSGTGLKFLIYIDILIFKTFFLESFKKYTKNT